ncbi:Mitochondrial import inner membrane translocase subunit TIM22 [Nosema granulosis]|uniref:Mitochondrial import inner membrane translocase subunit TIM22 n=1 Tax=Nosema granulosis TaxID=83296 RepID=A0A9P6GYK7_9MICR|nr:Mitochondrial import inner membrane translocase subunit TIM22 [Nosema granulosis]
MLKEKFLKGLEKIKPKLVKTLTNTAQGYLFGCMVGLFTAKDKPTLADVHSSGKDFARLCGVYTATESMIEVLREKEDPYNGIMSGVITGTFCVKGGLSGTSLLGGSALGIYSGLNLLIDEKK